MEFNLFLLVLSIFYKRSFLDLFFFYKFIIFLFKLYELIYNILSILRNLISKYLFHNIFLFNPIFFTVALENILFLNFWGFLL